MKKILALLSAIILCSCGSQNEQKYPVGQISTGKGEMLFWLYDETPLHKESFIQLAEAHFWDSLHFNRVIENFVIQGGCPDTPEGFADSPYLIQPEFHAEIRHHYGALGAGRDGNAEKLSAGCQLYVVQNREGLPRLDGDYMIFGQMFNGFDVLDAIAQSPTDSTDTPLERINMKVNVLYLSKEELKKKGYDPEAAAGL